MRSLAVCLGDVHGPPVSAQHRGQSQTHILDLSVLAVFLGSTFFKGRKLAFLYFSWDTSSLSVMVWKCF